MTIENVSAKVVVIGSGPGGYTAAFRAADLLGEGVVLVERYNSLGGVCLNVGCIPSKALLHVAEMVTSTQHFNEMGIDFGKPNIDFNKVREFKDKTVGRLTGGLAQLAKMRKVKVVTGTASFMSPTTLSIKDKDGKETSQIQFEKAIIAAGSSVIDLPFLPEDPRVFDSTGALELRAVPKRMLVIGGGIIGMEMACVYEALGSKINVVELSPSILPGVDKDLMNVVHKFVKGKYENIWVNTKVVKVEAKKDGIWVTFEGDDKAPKAPERFDAVLSAVGRKPNGLALGLDKAGVTVDARGFIPVDTQMRTNVEHIFAIGDIVGQPMLAHKAIPEGRVAAEVIAGKKHYFEPKCIPNVAYTNPEVAWVGLTETEAKSQNIDVEIGVFPWAALGRALCLGRDEGLTKMIYDKKTHRILGAGIVGPHAGDLIGEVALAIEMGCEAEDISLTIHPHPTLSETIALATEVAEGTVTDLPNKKK